MNSSSKKISSFFLCHGSPYLAIQDNEYTQFLGSLGKTTKPKAIIIFTAHWEDKTTQISYINGTYEMFYDIYGFPKELYQVKYPAKGSPELAEKIKEALEKNGIKTQFDTKRGLDHGSWTLLCKLFPKADIPVVQMSVYPFMETKKQFEIGKALRDLDYDDVMVIGSGVSVHNLRNINFRDMNCEPYDWAVKFDDWLIEKVKNKDLTALANFMAEAPHARDAVPRAEHFVPLLITAGCIDSSKDPKVLYREYQAGSLSYLCFQFA